MTTEQAHRVSPRRIVYPTCQAKHPDNRLQGVSCGHALGSVPGPLRFIKLAARHERGDGRIWIQCPKTNCKTWNVFEPADE